MNENSIEDNVGVKLTLKERIIFWGWDKLSLLGDKPHTGYAMKLLPVAIAVVLVYKAVFGDWAPFVVYGLVPIGLAVKAKTGLIKILAGIMGGTVVLNFLVCRTSGGYEAMWQFWNGAIIAYAIVVLIGVMFNKYLVPDIISAMSELTHEQLDK